jgi:hypothetical protein
MAADEAAFIQIQTLVNAEIEARLSVYTWGRHAFASAGARGRRGYTGGFPMRKRFIHLAAAVVAAAMLWPLDAGARSGGMGGGGGSRGGGMMAGGGGGGMMAGGGGGGFAGRSFSGGMGGGGFAARSFSAGPMQGSGFAGRSFSAGGMRGGMMTSRAFVGGNPAFVGSSRFVGGNRFVAGSRFAGDRRFHRFHGRKFIAPAVVFGAAAYAYDDPYWYGYYDDGCLQWVQDWYGWRQVNVCY